MRLKRKKHFYTFDCFSVWYLGPLEPVGTGWNRLEPVSYTWKSAVTMTFAEMHVRFSTVGIGNDAHVLFPALVISS